MFTPAMQAAVTRTDKCYRGYIKMTACGGEVIYFRSHRDVGTPAELTSTAGIESLSVNSQTVDFDSARTTIGDMSLRVIDFDRTFSLFLRDMSTCSLKGSKVQYFAGYEGMPVDQFHCVSTHIMRNMKFRNKGYDLVASDPTRLGKTDIFGEECSASFGDLYDDFIPGDTEGNYVLQNEGEPIRVDRILSRERIGGGNNPYGTIQLAQNDPWEPQGGTEGEDPTIYLKVGTEIVEVESSGYRVFGEYYNEREPENTKPEQRVQIYNVTERRLFGSQFLEIDDDRRIHTHDQDVCFVTVLDGRAPWVLYAMMTGKDLDTGEKILQTNNHANISDEFIDIDSLRLGVNPAYDAMPLRFVYPQETDAKAFWEEQILRWLDAYFLIDCDGKLVLTPHDHPSEDDNARVITNTHIIRASDLEENPDVDTAFYVSWDKHPCEDKFIHSAAIELSDEYLEGECLERKVNICRFQGVRTDFNSLVFIQNRICKRLGDGAVPNWNAELVLCITQADLHPGNKIRLRTDQFIDHTTGLNMNRVFEITSVSADFITGTVTAKIKTRSKTPSTSAYASCLQETQPCGTYDGVGQVSINANVPNGVLPEGSGLQLPAGTYFHDGDLTINGDIDLTTQGTLGIVVNGVFTLNGSIRTIGMGFSGIESEPTFGSTETQGNGYGNNYSQGGARVICGFLPPDSPDDALPPCSCARGYQGNTCIGRNRTTVDVSSVAEIEAIRLEGNGGCYGGAGFINSAVSAQGGRGGNGGGGLFIVAHGFSVQNGTIDTSGADGMQGEARVIQTNPEPITLWGGSGAGGNSGRVLFVFDGGDVSSVGNFEDFMASQRGITPNSTTGCHGIESEASNDNRDERPVSVTKLNCVSQ